MITEETKTIEINGTKYISYAQKEQDGGTMHFMTKQNGLQKHIYMIFEKNGKFGKVSKIR